MEKQKWINEGGVMFPIPGYAAIYPTPGNGVFQILQDRNGRLGLEKIDETFVFNFKLYDLGCDKMFQQVIKTWFSDPFVKGNKNLGVIFNGIKGTGKTIAAKVLSNKMGLPVIVVSKPLDGLLEFIQSLCFECVILIDEAEKTFDNNKEELLKMIDGVYNNARKLYLLTTNKLSVDENLIGRPGRIRYVKEFGNLTPKAVSDYIDDNLEDTTLKSQILDIVDSLTISTIDILKSIVDEFNIHGKLDDEKMLNIPRASYRFDVVKFSGLNPDKFDELKKYITSNIGKNDSLKTWLKKEAETRKDSNGTDVKYTYEEVIEERFDCWLHHQNVPSSSSFIHAGQVIRSETVIESADEYGFYVVEDSWCNHGLYCITNAYGSPSLYRGGLAY